MKTPRQILLERHRPNEAKLDAIRHAALEILGNSKAVPISDPGPGIFLGFISALRNGALNLWSELIWPCRRIWTGLAAAWVFILLANVSLHGDSHVTIAKAAPTPEMITAWRQQERQLAELIGPAESRAARPLRPFSPRPSSERRLEMLIA